MCFHEKDSSGYTFKKHIYLISPEKKAESSNSCNAQNSITFSERMWENSQP